MLKDRLLKEIPGYIKKNIDNIRASGVNISDCREDIELKFLAQGEYNVNFVIEGPGNKYVFRVNTGSQIESDNQIKYEFDAIKFLEKSGVTPKVFYLDDSKSELEYGLLIMEFLPGNHLDYYKSIDTAGELIASVHRVPIAGADNFIIEREIFTDRIKEGQRLLKDVWNSDCVDIEVKKFFEKFINWTVDNENNQKYFLDNPWMVINNTELNSGNFLINDNGKSYIIDWEKPVISDPCQDVTQFLAVTTTLWKTDYILNKEDEKKFYKSYINTLGYDKEIRERVRLYTPYLYLRALSWCAFAYLEYMKDDRGIKNMDTFNTIKEFTDIDFMRGLLRPYF